LAQPTISIVSTLLITAILPLIILLMATELSLKYPLKRKNIGTVLAIIGILEVLGFFMLSFTFEGVTYRIPFSPRLIMVMQGSITLTGGLVILYYAKPQRINNTEKPNPPNVEKQEIPLRQDATDQKKQIGTIDDIIIETENGTT
jgi:predicted membrane protein